MRCELLPIGSESLMKRTGSDLVPNIVSLQKRFGVEKWNKKRRGK